MADLLIIGAGPAGCSAAIYANRFNMKAEIIYDLIGGVISQAHLVENWPGIKSITGFDLSQQLFEHVTSLGIKATQAHVDTIYKQQDGTFLIKAGNQESFAKNVLITTGTFPRKLNIPGEQELLGKGVSYCAVCDGAFFKGKTVVVIGGSDSACNDCQLLAEYAEKVYIVYRRDSLRAEDVNVRSVQNNPKVEIIYNAYPTEIKGQNKVEKLVLDNKRELDVDGVFVAIGREPLTGMLDHLEVEYSDKGEIIVDKYKMTKTPGLFAAGDIIPGVKQALTASAYGVEAVFGIREFNKRKSA